VQASATGGDNAWIFGGPYSSVQHISGTLPQHRASFKIKGAMYSPQQCFLKELGDKLQQKGIAIKASAVSDLPTKEWFTLESPSLEAIVKCTNKQSINLFSEALSQLAGENPEATLKSLLTRIGTDASGVVLKDGCGLSALSAIPAGVFTDYLCWADRALGASFLNSLPVAGVDRGLNSYCASYPVLKNNLRAKTGSFFGVRSLAGYFTDAQGERYAFCVIINHYTCPASELYNAVGRLLAELVGK
jgi:D-alanyl-D-alanine carboxypeptidase/D-alanyl-D-alanine-endopeptidase (penicillin-binding protein 4)